MTLQEFEQVKQKTRLSQADRDLLEPYRVKRAVIMAAGLGSRLRPLTYETPKPLIYVKGKRIIDTIIEALVGNGIDEIYIVRGYQYEKFDVLLEQYPFLHMLNNLMYDKGNNILSVCTAGSLIAGAYVMPADIYISNAAVFPTYQYASNVLGYRVAETDDWCIETDRQNIISRLAPGGVNCFKDTGIFYWNEEDGKQLSRDIASVCSTATGYQRYWSSVPFDMYRTRYRSYIRECREKDVIEIDTLEDLAQIDPSYRE